MRTFRLAAVSVIALLALPALAACGGDDNTTNTPTKAASTSSSTSPTSSAATSPTSGANNAAQDLRQAATNLKTSSFKIVYDMSQTDASGSTKQGTLTLIQKDKKSYVGGTGDVFGTSSGTFALIDDGTNSYLCTASPQKACIKTKSTGGAGGAAAIAAAFSPDKVLEKLNKSGATVKQVANQTIAGRDAKCYSVTDSNGTGTGCIDAKANLLLLADGKDLTTAGTKTTMKATEVNTSPADSEFEPPYPVQSLPGQ